MKGNKRMNGYLICALSFLGLFTVIVGTLVGTMVKTKAETGTVKRIERLVYVGADPNGCFVERELVEQEAIGRVMDRFDVCPMTEASVGDMAVIRTVLGADFAVKIYFDGVDTPAVMYYTFTDRVAVITPDGFCAVSERPMMDTEAVRNEFWRKEGGWNAGTVDRRG